MLGVKTKLAGWPGVCLCSSKHEGCVGGQGGAGRGLNHTLHMQPASQPASYVSCLDTIQERKMPHRAGSALSVVLNINTN